MLDFEDIVLHSSLISKTSHPSTTMQKIDLDSRHKEGRDDRKCDHKESSITGLGRLVASSIVQVLKNHHLNDYLKKKKMNSPPI
ncbi:MAG: hypothetical protein QS748_00995 [Candidatus Endonucleobacter bathymodioli]|uniref:Uncharacterized protein n=1 Tax=Candidatus Endonucleibacter bathymodioli TaxID=539814 RepID=A0AA90NYZ1_9GAMM|nr:hypothetical protein [Candidatus Endonucleobacter bathymodioli]